MFSFYFSLSAPACNDCLPGHPLSLWIWVSNKHHVDLRPWVCPYLDNHCSSPWLNLQSCFLLFYPGSCFWPCSALCPVHFGLLVFSTFNVQACSWLVLWCGALSDPVAQFQVDSKDKHWINWWHPGLAAETRRDVPLFREFILIFTQILFHWWGKKRNYSLFELCWPCGKNLSGSWWSVFHLASVHHGLWKVEIHTRYVHRKHGIQQPLYPQLTLSFYQA